MAAAAYASVVSLMHVLDQIQQYPLGYLRLDRDQIETLREKVSFLQDCLEVHSQRFYEDLEGLARQIAAVADKAEDVIDSHVVNQLRKGSSDQAYMDLSISYEGIESVIENIDSIKKELMIITEGMTIQGGPRVSVPARSSALPSSGKNRTVGFEKQFDRIVLELTGDKCDLQVLPVIGMGGIGKTTLTRNAFDNSYIMRHFDSRIWLTVSQEYSMQGTLLGLLRTPDDQKNKEIGENSAELGEKLYKSLYDRRYLIVLDDVWSPDVWSDIKSFFPDNKNGSRIMVTTRLSNVAVSFGSNNPFLMDFLDKDQSWNLFCEKAFMGEGCPPELEKAGRRIAESCKGLPLAIIVVGGLLSKSNMTREYWESIAENVNSFANSGDDEHCLKILSLSYNHLPIHLKPCFLYMREFPQDDRIRVSELIRLWVAQGFLKSISGKTLEEVAREYLEDLIGRNLILIHEWTKSGKMKKCNIHDLLRDLCVRKAHSEHFYCVPKVQKISEPPMKTTRREWTKSEIGKMKYCRSRDLSRGSRNREAHGKHFHPQNFPEVRKISQSFMEARSCFLCSHRGASTKIDLPLVVVASQSTSLATCFVCDHCTNMHPQLNRLTLVKVLDSKFGCGNIPHPTKVRYLSAFWYCKFVGNLNLLWNLQTLIIVSNLLEALPSEIWELTPLRHLITKPCNAVLPDPPLITQDDRQYSTIILKNLQTLSRIRNFRWSEDAIERIPNLMKLGIVYYCRDKEWSHYSLHNLFYLHKLESLKLEAGALPTLKKITFPHSLKKLSLRECKIPWEEMTIIGLLPNLEVLKLHYQASKGLEWNPIEGEFLQLKRLVISTDDLIHWGVEKIHFPNLEHLEIQCAYALKEIPSDIGEIETLLSIRLFHCSNSINNSAKEILKEQLSLGNEDLQLYVDDKRVLPDNC